MALIKCPECGKEVSDKAPACPSCAYPLQATTIEATGKSWKGTLIVSVLAMIFGVIGLFASGATGAGGWIAFILMIGGFIGYLCSRIGGWWEHG